MSTSGETKGAVHLTIAILASAVVVFAGTNIDDLVVLTALFGSRGLERRRIVAGQYAGMAALVVVSAVIAAGLVVVPDRWVGVVGIVPLGLGVRGLLRGGEHRAPVVTSALGVAGLTVANGADNVSVYSPLFREAGRASIGFVAVFAVLVAVWLAAAAFLASRRPVAAALDRFGHRLVPMVFIAIGLVLVAGAVFG